MLVMLVMLVMWMPSCFFRLRKGLASAQVCSADAVACGIKATRGSRMPSTVRKWYHLPPQGS